MCRSALAVYIPASLLLSNMSGNFPFQLLPTPGTYFSPSSHIGSFLSFGAQLKYLSLREDFPTTVIKKKSSCHYFLYQILASAQFVIISSAFQFLCLLSQLQCEHLNILCPVAGVCPVISRMNDCGELSLFLLFSYPASLPSSSKSRTPLFCGELLPYGLRELTLPHPQSDQNGHSDWFRDEHVTLTESVSAPLTAREIYWMVAFKGDSGIMSYL